MLNLSHIEKRNFVNGSGSRYVIWVQGCSFHCKDCWNKYTWDPNIKNFKKVDEVFSEIRTTTNIDGVTFSGGEPLLQAAPLLKLSLLIREYTNLNIHIFTGYEQDEERSEVQNQLLSYADTIVFGRFDNTKINNNQIVVNKDDGNWVYNNSDIEIDIDKDSNLLVTGYPDNNFLDSIKGIQ